MGKPGPHVLETILRPHLAAPPGTRPHQISGEELAEVYRVLQAGARVIAQASWVSGLVPGQYPSLDSAVSQFRDATIQALPILGPDCDPGDALG